MKKENEDSAEMKKKMEWKIYSLESPSYNLVMAANLQVYWHRFSYFSLYLLFGAVIRGCWLVLCPLHDQVVSLVFASLQSNKWNS